MFYLKRMKMMRKMEKRKNKIPLLKKKMKLKA